MPYYPPRFNVWVEIRDNNGSRGWSICQVRGPKPNLVLVGDDDYDGFAVNPIIEVLFPAGSDVRSATTGAGADPDALFFGGSGTQRMFTLAVVDVGVGFPNEYRIAMCQFQGEGVPFNTPQFRPDPAFLPPEGYVPLPIIPPGDPPLP